MSWTWRRSGLTAGSLPGSVTDSTAALLSLDQEELSGSRKPTGGVWGAATRVARRPGPSAEATTASPDQSIGQRPRTVLDQLLEHMQIGHDDRKVWFELNERDARDGELPLRLDTMPISSIDRLISSACVSTPDIRTVTTILWTRAEGIERASTTGLGMQELNRRSRRSRATDVTTDGQGRPRRRLKRRPRTTIPKRDQHAAQESLSGREFTDPVGHTVEPPVGLAITALARRGARQAIERSSSLVLSGTRCPHR